MKRVTSTVVQQALFQLRDLSMAKMQLMQMVEQLDFLLIHLSMYMPFIQQALLMGELPAKTHLD